MSESISIAPPVDEAPVFNIQRMYLKDMSLEQPNSPAILAEELEPRVEIGLQVTVEALVEGMFEVCVMATVTARADDQRTLFLIEAKQAGIFEIRHMVPEQLQMVLGVACPSMIFPYLRAIVSDVSTRAGFPPVLLAEVNFQAMFEAQQQQLAQQQAAN